MCISNYLKLIRFFGFVLIALVAPISQVVAQPFGLTQRTAVTGVTIPLSNPEVSNFVSPFGSALTFGAPIFVTAPQDGTNRLFVVEQSGRIKVFNNVDGTATSTEFLNIASRITYGGEMGLLGLAFHPDYAQNGFFYVHYNAGSGSTARSVFARFKVSTSNPNVADVTSEKIILTVSQVNFDGQVYGNHKGGMIAFGPDKMLYIALGDGGSGGDAFNTGQDCSDMLGNILRINPSTTDSASPAYSIPNDNPFGGSANYSCGFLQNAASRSCGIAGGVDRTKICKEVYAYGLRNPWRFSFDRETGALWLGDVGQSAREEINVVNAGNNLGWPVYEGNQGYRTVTGTSPQPATLPPQTFTTPIIDYPRSDGSVVTGGYVYRGTRVPSLYGKYIYADFGSGKAWALSWNKNSNNQIVRVANVSIGTLAGPSSFGEDKNGELFQLDYYSGTVKRIGAASGSGSTPIPTTLSATGLFSNVATLTPKAGVIEYDVNAPLWSDGANKRRWIALPGSQTITFHATEAYTFPVGTALIKHFEQAGSPPKRLETRVFFRHTEGWAGYTYKWNTAGTDATLLTDAVTENGWYYPSRVNCLSCHTESAGRVLSVRTRQLNRNFTYPAATDNQLRSWNNIGLFSTNIGSATSYEAYPTYNDSTVSVDLRARAYLAANCSNCHNPGEPRPGVVDLRYGIPQDSMHLVNETPAYGNLGIANAVRLKPGDIASSILYQRMDTLGINRMPPLASSVKDPTGLSLISAWINSLGSTGAPPREPDSLRLIMP